MGQINKRMSERMASISLRVSASATNNNLAAHFDVNGRNSPSEFAVVHKSIVNVVTASASKVTDVRRQGGEAAAAGEGGSGGVGEDDETRQQQVLVKDAAAGEATPSSTMQVGTRERVFVSVCV